MYVIKLRVFLFPIVNLYTGFNSLKHFFKNEKRNFKVLMLKNGAYLCFLIESIANL